MTLDVDLEREQNIEELRRIAQALKALNQLLLEALAKKSREVERLRGKPGDLQPWEFAAGMSSTTAAATVTKRRRSYYFDRAFVSGHAAAGPVDAGR